MDSQWNHEAGNFEIDSSDYEKAFENYISDVDDDEGESRDENCFGGNRELRFPSPQLHA